VKVLLIQIDGKLPNLALMRIAAHHRERGDCVELRRGNDFGGLFDEPFDRVYASTIFERSRPLAYRVLDTYPGAIIGGTGWDLVRRTEDAGITTAKMDYSIYPEYRQSIGFAMRGCRLRCRSVWFPLKRAAPARRAPSRKFGAAIRAVGYVLAGGDEFWALQSAAIRYMLELPGLLPARTRAFGGGFFCRRLPPVLLRQKK
jgi:hypothetical protein